jgi:hypothetical protein
VPPVNKNETPAVNTRAKAAETLREAAVRAGHFDLRGVTILQYGAAALSALSTTFKMFARSIAVLRSFGEAEYFKQRRRSNCPARSAGRTDGSNFFYFL